MRKALSNFDESNVNIGAFAVSCANDRGRRLLGSGTVEVPFIFDVLSPRCKRIDGQDGREKYAGPADSRIARSSSRGSFDTPGLARMHIPSASGNLTRLSAHLFRLV